MEQGHLRAHQRLHALAIAFVPLVGTAAAVWLGVRNGVTWLDMTLLAVMYLVNMIGISVGFHRQFSHRSFKAKPWLRALLAVFGSTAAQGSVVYWVSNHRRHH